MATFDNRGFIVALNKNDVFVFGSNKDGHHVGGAARQAFDDFGAIWGVGFGPQGKCYAIPTMDLPLEIITHYITQFVEYARLTPDKTYYVTPIGCGIAGWSAEEMGEIWSSLELPDNVKLI